MILRAPLNKLFNLPYVKKIHQQIYDVLHKYSFFKLKSLVKHQAFNMILKHFVSEGHMNDMIMADPALACHPIEYKIGLEDLMEIASE